MLEDDEPEPLLIKHDQAMRMIGYGPSYYWGLVREDKITVVQSGRAGRAYLPSVKAYVQELLAAPKTKKAMPSRWRRSTGKAREELATE